MKIIIKSTKELGLSILFFTLPLLAKAASPASPAPAGTGGSKVAIPSTGITSAQGVLNSFCVIFDWAFYFLIALSVFFVIVAAYRYLTANGNSEKVGQATKTITYAAVAIVVALLASQTPRIVGNFFGQNLQSCGSSDGLTPQISSTFTPGNPL